METQKVKFGLSIYLVYGPKIKTSIINDLTIEFYTIILTSHHLLVNYHIISGKQGCDPRIIDGKNSKNTKSKLTIKGRHVHCKDLVV